MPRDARDTGGGRGRTRNEEKAVGFQEDLRQIMLGIEAGVWIFRQGAGCQSGLGTSDHLRCLAEAESQVTVAAHVFSGFTLGTGLSRPAR